MKDYKWIQWIGFRKLHAVRHWDRNEGGYDTHISACGIAQCNNDIFCVPPSARIKCKNCEKELKNIKEIYGK